MPSDSRGQENHGVCLLAGCQRLVPDTKASTWPAEWHSGAFCTLTEETQCRELVPQLWTHHFVTSRKCQKYQRLVWNLKSLRRSLFVFVPSNGYSRSCGRFLWFKKVKWGHHKEGWCSQPGAIFRGDIPSSTGEASERPYKCRLMRLLEDLPFWRKEAYKNFIEKLGHSFIPKRLLQVLANTSEQTDL